MDDRDQLMIITIGGVLFLLYIAMAFDDLDR
jgi:hypothetical protein